MVSIFSATDSVLGKRVEMEGGRERRRVRVRGK